MCGYLYRETSRTSVSGGECLQFPCGWLAIQAASPGFLMYLNESKQTKKRHRSPVRIVLSDTARLPTWTQRQHLISQDFSSDEFSLHSVPTHRLGSLEDQPLSLKATSQKKKRKRAHLTCLTPITTLQRSRRNDLRVAPLSIY